MAEEKLREIYRDLITANHILHYNKVVDGFGHISIRHPDQPDVYIMSGYLAPAAVEKPEDLIQYRVEDSSPVDPNASRGYSERFIHSEIYKRFPLVNCVVHSHSEDVLPFVVGDIPLLPIYHMAGFLGQHVPTFDIADVYDGQRGDKPDMLVNSSPLGAALASKFSASATDAQGAAHASSKTDNGSGEDNRSGESETDYTVVLMRRHGFTTVGRNIPHAIFRAIYTCSNARILTTANLLQQGSRGGDGGPTSSPLLHYLTEDQSDECKYRHERFADKPWKMWVREVEAAPLYVNRG